MTGNFSYDQSIFSYNPSLTPSSQTIDSSTVKNISRLLKIWKDRATFNPKIQAELDTIWSTKQLEVKSEETAISADTASSTEAEASPAKKPKRGTDNVVVVKFFLIFVICTYCPRPQPVQA